MQIDKITLADQVYLYVEKRVSFEGSQIAEAMGAGFGQVHGWAEANGVALQSMPISVYTEMPSGSQMTFRVGFFIDPNDAQKATGDVSTETIAAGAVYKATHIGPYASLNQSHKALWDHMESDGAKPTMPVWETYIDDPAETPEAKLRTEVYRKAG